MTSKARNRLKVLAILALPVMVFLGFLISQTLAPAPSNPPSQNTNTATNAVDSLR